MKRRLSRITAVMLATILFLTSSGVEALASGITHPYFDREMVAEMTKLVGSEEGAEAMLQTLYEHGFVDRKGMPKQNEKFNVNGILMNEAELRTEAAKHVTDEQDLVLVDGARVTWGELKSLLAVKEMQDYLKTAGEAGYTLKEESLNSLTEALQAGRINIVNTPFLSSVKGPDTPASGYDRIYLTEVGTDIYKVDFEKTSATILDDYNLRSFEDMTYEIHSNHVYEDSQGQQYIDVKALESPKKEEASRVTIALGVLKGDGQYSVKHVSETFRAIRYDLPASLVDANGGFVVPIEISASRDTTIGECSVDMYIENGDVLTYVPLAEDGVDPSQATDHITIHFEDGQDQIKLPGYNVYFNYDQFDPNQLHESDHCAVMSYFTFRNCQNCMIGLERHHVYDNDATYAFNYGTYEVVPFYVSLPLGPEQGNYYQIGGDADHNDTDRDGYIDFGVVDDWTYRHTSELRPALIVPEGIYYPGDRIPFKIKLNTWIKNNRLDDSTTVGHGFGGNVKINGQGEMTSDGVTFKDYFSLDGPMNDDYCNTLYGVYVCTREIDSSTLTASDLYIFDNGTTTTQKLDAPYNREASVFTFTDFADDGSFIGTEVTKFNYSNSDFVAAGQAAEEEIGKGINFAQLESSGNIAISSPDKTKSFDFANASYVYLDGDYYLKVPVLSFKDGSDVPNIDYIQWITSDVIMTPGERPYLKSLLAASTVRDSEGNEYSYLEKVFIKLRDDEYKYTDPATGKPVTITEIPEYIYMKAEMDGSEDGSFACSIAGTDCNMLGNMELVGLRTIGGTTDITSVLSSQTPSTLSDKLESGEWVRMLLTGAVYDERCERININNSPERYWFNNRGRDRSYSQHLLLPVIDFAKICLTEEDLDIKYNDTWAYYEDGTDPDSHVISELLPKAYNSYIKNNKELTLSYEVHETNSKGQQCDGTSAANFTWTSSDPTIATITDTVENGITTGVIAFTGKAGTVHFCLENDMSGVIWKSDSLTVSETKEPFMYIPSTSQTVVALQGTAADIAFCSNIPTYNDMKDQGCTTTYEMDIFPAYIDGNNKWYIDKSEGSILDKPLTVTATADQPASSITIPSGVLTDVSASGDISYVAVITCKYTGPTDYISGNTGYTNNIDGTFTFEAQAAIKVKNAPLKLELETDKIYYLDDEDISIGVKVTQGSLGTNASWSWNCSTDDKVEWTANRTGTGAKSFPDSISIPAGLISDDPTICNSVLKTPVTITVSASNNPEEDGYSSASTTIYVYNSKAIDILVSKAIAGSNSAIVDEEHDIVTLDNEPYIQSIADSDGTIVGEGLDIASLQTDVTLQAIISLNYGDYVWGLVSDQMKWKATDKFMDADAANLYYAAGGTYSNVDHSLLPSYMPISSFTLVGEKEGTSVITATHANTGCETSITVDVHRLENKLYLFQFYPLTKTQLTYIDGQGNKKSVSSQDNGQLVLYEPNGIAKDSVLSYGGLIGETIYSGYTTGKFLESGERNEALGELYPVNVREMSKMEEADLFIKLPNGKPLADSDVTLHGGVYYKNRQADHANVKADGKLTKIDGYEYQPQMDLLTPEQAKDSAQNRQGSDETSNGLEALTFHTDKNGMIRVVLNMEQLRSNYKLEGEDDFMFVFQVEVNGFKPQIVTHTLLNESGVRADASIVSLELAASAFNIQKKPFITDISETRTLSDGTTRNTTIGSEVKALGADTKYPVRTVFFDTMLWGIEDIIATSSEDTQAAPGGDYSRYNVYFSDILKGTEHNRILGQGSSDQTCTIWYYPFSTIPMSTTSLLCSAEGYQKEDKSGLWLGFEESVNVDYAVFDNDKVISRSRFPYQISNNLSALDIAKDPKFYDMLVKMVEEQGGDPDISIGDIVPGGDMLAASISFISGLVTGGNGQQNILVVPTADPNIYKILWTMGDEKGIFTDEDAHAQEEKDEGIVTHFGDQDPKDLDKALDEFMGEATEEDDDDDKLEFKFGGALIGEAKNTKDGWNLSLTGGSVSIGAEYEVFKYDENFLVGPVPVTITFGVKAGMKKTVTVDRIYKQWYRDAAGNLHDEPGFESNGYDEWEKATNEDGTDMIETSYGVLLDACLTGEVEAFAGVGFDYSVIALKLGIFGKVSAGLYWAVGVSGLEKNHVMFGAGVAMEGQIALQFKAQILFMTYVQNFASVEFKAGIQSDGYTELIELFHSPTMMGDEYAGGFASGKAEFDNKSAYGDTSKSLQMKRGDSILKCFTEENENYGTISLSDDNKYLFYTDNFSASYAKTDGTNMGTISEPDMDGNNAAMNGKGDFGHFYMDGCGTEENLFATWVVQTQKNYEGQGTPAELAMALNSTEVAASVYNAANDTWTTTRLSDNGAPDMSPSICSYGNKAVVVWRSLYGNDTSNPLNFNVDDNLVFKYYDGKKWSETPAILYNGTNGSVQSVDTCMIDNTYAGVVFTVQTDENGAPEGLETYYAVFDPEYDGKDVNVYNISSSPNASDENAKIVNIGDGENVVAWVTNQKADGTAGTDIRLIGVKNSGLYFTGISLDSSIPESITALDSSVNVTADFNIYADPTTGDLTVAWAVPLPAEDGEVKNSKSEIYAVRLTKDAQTQQYTMTTPMLIYTTNGGTITDDFRMFCQGNKVVLFLADTVYKGNPEIAGYITVDQLVFRTDYASDEEYNKAVADFNKQYPNGVPVSEVPGYYMLDRQVKEMKQELTLLDISYDVDTVIPGITIPVAFTVKNTGIGNIDKIVIGDKTYDVNLGPNDKTRVNVLYTISNPAVEDEDFVIKSENNAFKEITGTLKFNIPKVEIGDVSVVSEGEGERTVSVLLENNSLVPMDGSDRTLEVGLYTDLSMETQIGETYVVSSDPVETSLVDLDAETVNFDVSIEDYVNTVNEGKKDDEKVGIGTTAEIPKDGIELIAISRVKNDDGDVLYENAQRVRLYSMRTDAESPVIEQISNPEVIADDPSEVDEEGNPTGSGIVKVDGLIRNESIMDKESKCYAIKVLDKDGKVLAEQVVEAELTPEHEVTFNCEIAIPSLADYSETIIEEVTEAKLDTPKAAGYQFEGWYKDAEFTEEIGADDLFGYAKWSVLEADITGVHLELKGDIGMSFHTYISPEAEDGYMILSVRGEEIAKITPAECKKDASGKYLFKCYLNVAQMSEDVTATYYWGDNKSVSKSISIEGYAQKLIGSDAYTEPEKNLVKAMINYGHYAQPSLSVANGWEIGKDFVETKTVYGSLTATATDLAPYACVKSGSDSSINGVSMNLMLASKTSLNMLIKTDEKPTATVNGKEVGTSLTSDGRYCLTICDIGADSLGDAYTVVINDSVTYKISALTYANIVLNSSSYSEADKDAAKALYEYYVATKSFVDKSK